jgi:tRNA(Ile)-lysidine synthase
MLTVERALIEATLAENGLSWINDSSNADEHLSRNLLRHRALPMLQARFPAKQALAGAAARFAEAAALLDERADEDLASCSVDGVIAINCLVKLSPARQRNLLHRALSVCGGRVASAARLEDLRRQIGHASADTRAVVEFGQLEVHLWRGGLWRVPVTEHAPRLPLSWEGEPELDWASGKLVFQPMMGEGIAAAGPLGESWSIRRRQGGERLKLAWDRPRQQVKHLLQHAAVPPWERDRLPMLWCGERLVWVPGFPIDPGYRVAPGEVGWVPRWLG